MVIGWCGPALNFFVAPATWECHVAAEWLTFLWTRGTAEAKEAHFEQLRRGAQSDHVRGGVRWSANAPFLGPLYKFMCQYPVPLFAESQV